MYMCSQTCVRTHVRCVCMYNTRYFDMKKELKTL